MGNLIVHNAAAFANNCGALGIRVKNSENPEAVILKIRYHDGPALFDIVCDVGLI